MKKRTLIAIILLFLIAITGIRLLWLQYQASSELGVARDGSLDLRDWRPAEDPVLLLNGEWAYYPNMLLEPGATSDSGGEPLYVQLPSDTRGLPGPEDNSILGYGSYRLRVLVDADPGQDYILRVPAISSSSALYVNGQKLAQSGEPAERGEDYAPHIAPYTAKLALHGDVLDIVIHVANFDDRALSGIMPPIKLGTEGAMNRAQFISIGSQLAVVLFLLLHTVYAVALYLIGSRDRGPISFALTTLCAAMTVLIDEDRLLTVWFGVGFEWTWKLFYISYLGAAAFTLQFAKQLLPGFSIMRHTRLFLYICALYSLLIICLPVSVLSYADWLHTALTVAPYMVIPILALAAIRRGDPDMIFILLGMLAIASNTAWGIAKYTGLIAGGFYPIDMIIAFISLALFWFKRYFRSTNRTARLAAQLQAADKLKDEFLANTSHELRNPLHGILNIADSLLQNGGRVDEERNRARLQLLLSVGRRMSHMLNDLTDLTLIREQRMKLHRSAFHLQAVAAGTVGMIRYMTEGKPLLLRNEIPASLPHVMADEDRLIQILLNLLHNAVKYTPEGEIVIRARSKNGMVQVEVADTGIGMDAETLGKIFEPYERGDGATARGAGGIGLGLAISRQLVELHGGKLTASSAPGQGSVFAFTLPIAKAGDAAVANGERPRRRPEERLTQQPAVLPVTPAEGAPGAALLHESASEQPSGAEALAAAGNFVAARGEEDRIYAGNDRGLTGSSTAARGEQAAASSETSGDKLRLLAVDDDTVNLRVLQDVLRIEGFEIGTATSGDEALALLDAGPWDLLIADVMMPGMSGYELAQAVRERFSRSELPILLLTARSRTEDVEAGFRFGANDYLTKPVDATVLRARVRALAEVTRAAREQARLEAAWLQAQVEPHFLFNTLNSVAALSEIDLERMRNLLHAFGDYLRASYDFHNAEQFVPLAKELELIRMYLAIEKERFEDRIRVLWEVDESLPLLVPPLTLQPLVENAVRHGILQRESGGMIAIAVQDLGDRAEISVHDNGVGMEEETLRRAMLKEPLAARPRGVGLYNTDHRLRQLYGEGLRIASIPGEGTTVSFIVRK